jgi:hypothetical protein
MKDINSKKEQDYNYLLNQSEKIRKDFNIKMFDNEALEKKLRYLQNENYELKKLVNDSEQRLLK